VTDAARLLHVRSELGYTDRPAQALPEEPEAVSREWQLQITAQAARRAQDARRETWLTSRMRIRVELEQLEHVFGREVGSDLRVIRRQLDRIGQRLYASR
jgi:hypothetical protein